jgi:iron complex outermembrane receptor protein
VVLVDPPALPSDSAVHGSANLMGASNGRMGAASGMLSGNFKKIPALAWRVQGTARRGGNYKAADYYLNNTGIKDLNYSAAVGYTKKHFDATLFYSHFNSEIGIFKGSEIGSTEDLEKRIAYGRPFDDGGFSYNIAAPKQEVKHDLLKAKIHFHINDYFHLDAQYGFQHDRRQEFDLRLGGRTVLPVMDLSLNTQTLDLSFDYFDGKQWKTTFGVSGSYEDNENVPGTYTTPLIPDYISRNLGVFAIGSWIKTNFQLEAGLRYDYKYLNALGYDYYQNLYGGIHHYNNASGSLGAIWNISPQWNINTNLGTAWRAPEVNELYSNGLHDGAAAYEIGDSKLKTEKSLKWIATLEYRNPKRWLNVDMDVYAQYFDDYIYLSPADSLWESLRGAFPTFKYKQTNARFLGADLTARLFFLKHFEYTFKGSLIRAKDISNNRFLPLIPTDKIVQSIQWKYDPAPFMHDTYLRFSHTYVARQNRYEPSSDYAPPPGAYQLLKISLGTSFPFGKQNLNVDFSINNLANTEYKDYMDRYRYYAHDLGRNYELRLAYTF